MVVRIEPPLRTDRIVRAHGRSIGWSEWGGPAAEPVLFCTGAAMTSSLGFCARQGVRLICVDRPGLGRSGPDPEKNFATWAADVAAVLKHLGIDRPPVVGFSQGGPFALALAAHGLVSAVALVAAQDDFTHPETMSLLPPELQSLVAAIEQDRDAVEASFSARVDPEGMWNLVVGMSGPHDRAIYESPSFAAAYRRSLEEGFAQGPGGYVRDLTLAMGQWPFRPEAITVPVHLWYGLLDTSPSHSPDFGATLARRFPHAVRHTLEHEGGSLLWTRGDEIVEALLATST